MKQSDTLKTPTRRQLAAERTRRKLLESALENFSRQPYAEVTVAGIARSAGVAHGLLSHHFSGKETLYAETIREISRQLRAATHIPEEGSVVSRLHQHFTAHLNFLSDHEDAACNLILRRAKATDVAREAFDAARQVGLQDVCKALNLDIDEPQLHLPLLGWSASCDEITLEWLKTGRPLPVEAVADLFLNFLTCAIQAAYRLAHTPALRNALTELRAQPAPR
ncbi:TetR/AcrR family transcriptional regulator [Streptomyces sp. DSM 118878]